MASSKSTPCPGRLWFGSPTALGASAPYRLKLTALAPACIPLDSRRPARDVGGLRISDSFLPDSESQTPPGPQPIAPAYQGQEGAQGKNQKKRPTLSTPLRWGGLAQRRRGENREDRECEHSTTALVSRKRIPPKGIDQGTGPTHTHGQVENATAPLRLCVLCDLCGWTFLPSGRPKTPPRPPREALRVRLEKRLPFQTTSI